MADSMSSTHWLSQLFPHLVILTSMNFSHFDIFWMSIRLLEDR